MTNIKVININGEKCHSLSFEMDLEKITLSKTTIYNVVRCMTINQRLLRSGHYKSKSGLSGSGRKIRPQKRTGRSRQGTSKEIHMRGGGVKFGFSGNKEKDLHKRYRAYRKINAKVKSKVMIALIANKLFNNNLVVVNSYESISKTKDANSFLNQLQSKTHTVVYKDLKDSQPFGNLKCNVVNIASLNILDIIKKEAVVLDEQSFNQLIENTIKEKCKKI